MTAPEIMDEIWRMTRRLQNHVLPERERIKGAEYLCDLWDKLHKLQQENKRAA